MAREKLVELIEKHAQSTGQTLTQEELADAADSLLSFVGLLIEADEKVAKTNGRQHIRNSNHPHKA